MCECEERIVLCGRTCPETVLRRKGRVVVVMVVRLIGIRRRFPIGGDLLFDRSVLSGLTQLLELFLR